MRDEIQTSGGLGIILLEILFHRLIHTVPAQYALITGYGSIERLYVDSVWFREHDPFTVDQADLFQLIQELDRFLLAAAHGIRDLINGVVDEHTPEIIMPVVFP